MNAFLHLATAKPAGGAAIGEIVGATAAAMVALAVLFWLSWTHRAGKNDVLRRLAQWSSDVSGFLKPWAALPVGVATAALLIALFGMYWDISLHIDAGRDPGPLANPAHYFILVGLGGIFAAGVLSIVLPEERPSRAAVKITRDWYAPVSGIVMTACSGFALLGFPLDDAWHRLFGQDVTLWGPTHLMLIGGAGLSLMGHATMMVEGRLPKEQRKTGGVFSVIMRVRYAFVFGGLLIGLSTFQGEFDFGVPQFQEIFQPVLIAFAAGVALVGARIWAGRGGALGAVAFFWIVRGLVSLLVGPVLGEITPHLPLYFAEAAIVEIVALYLVKPERTYRFGAVCGLLIGTLGLAAEWGWSHVWMPIPWDDSLLASVATVVPVVGVASGLIGAFIGASLRFPIRPRELRIPPLAPAVVGFGVFAVAIGYGLSVEADKGVRAAVSLEQTQGPPDREAIATVRLDPPGAADDARWLTATAWQGGKLVVDGLKKVGPGAYRSTRPLPLHGDWKTLIRLSTHGSLTAVPVYLPADPAIPVPGVAAKPQFTREFVSDKKILQRELKGNVDPALFTLATAVVGLIALALIALLTWALRRLDYSVEGAGPPSRPSTAPVTGRVAAGGAA